MLLDNDDSVVDFLANFLVDFQANFLVNCLADFLANFPAPLLVHLLVHLLLHLLVDYELVADFGFDFALVDVAASDGRAVVVDDVVVAFADAVELVYFDIDA